MGRIADAVLAAARREIGTVERPKNSNNVKYNTWYYKQEVYDGKNGGKYPWCMAFVQWVFCEAGFPLPYKTASCSALLNWYKKNAPELVHTEPAPGDIVIYKGHTGIFEKYGPDPKYMYVIEGNTAVGNDDNGGCVMRRYRKISLVGDDIDIEDIVWYGSVDSVADMAAQVGVANSAPMK
ncbi:MAG: CHAP domain-containing protein, partial [Oscillospiraceae bacterium]|nr:CHAP domain-containing protein [Oscillospiraceae bacterium]